MRIIQFDTTDSTGRAVESRRVETLDGERHEIDISPDGTAEVADELAEMLITDETEAVGPADSEIDESDTDGHVCEDCGRVFESPAALGGHRPHCEERAEHLDEEEDEEDGEEGDNGGDADSETET